MHPKILDCINSDSAETGRINIFSLICYGELDEYELISIFNIDPLEIPKEFRLSLAMAGNVITSSPNSSIEPHVNLYKSKLLTSLEKPSRAMISILSPREKYET